MSHVVDLNLVIKDLDSLKKACEELGLELVEGQKTYKWFGTFMGDSPLPEGFTAKDLGKCEHAIRVPGSNTAYEIGIVKRKDGNGYTALWDFWNGGYGLKAKIHDSQGLENNGDMLMQNYASQVSIKQAKKKGFTVTKTVASNGEIILTARRMARRS